MHSCLLIKDFEHDAWLFDIECCLRGWVSFFSFEFSSVPVLEPQVEVLVKNHACSGAGYKRVGAGWAPESCSKPEEGLHGRWIVEPSYLEKSSQRYHCAHHYNGDAHLVAKRRAKLHQIFIRWTWREIRANFRFLRSAQTSCNSPFELERADERLDLRG